MSAAAAIRLLAASQRARGEIDAAISEIMACIATQDWSGVEAARDRAAAAFEAFLDATIATQREAANGD